MQSLQYILVQGSQDLTASLLMLHKLQEAVNGYKEAHPP